MRGTIRTTTSFLELLELACLVEGNAFALTIWRMAFRKVFTTFRQVRMFYLSSRFWRSDINYLCLALKEVVEV